MKNDLEIQPEAPFQSLSLLQKIQKGHGDPRQLNPEDRRQLVAFLVTEGQSTADIAHLLKVSDRTIERDRKALRQENALDKDPQLTSQMAGRLCAEAELCVQRIRKYQREHDATSAVKIDAEQRCFQILAQLTEKLQSMGYVESIRQRFEGQVTCQVGPTPSLQEIMQEAQRLNRIQASLSEDPEQTEPPKKTKRSLKRRTRDAISR